VCLVNCILHTGLAVIVLYKKKWIFINWIIISVYQLTNKNIDGIGTIKPLNFNITITNNKIKDENFILCHFIYIFL